MDVFFAQGFEVFEDIGVGAIPALMAALSHEDWRVQRCAANALAFLGPTAQAAAPALAQALANPKARVRRAVLNALLSIEVMPPSALPHLMKLLRNPGPPETVQAARAVALLGPAAEEALPLLIKGLDHASLFYRGAAARALGQIGIKRSDVITALSENFLLDEPNRYALTRSLAQLAPDLLQTLLPTLDGEALIRSLFALAYLGPEAGPLFPTVFDLYKTASRDASFQTITLRNGDRYSLNEGLLLALARMGAQAAEAIPLLLEQAERDDDNLPVVHFLPSSFGLPLAGALRTLLLETFLETQSQQERQPEREAAQVIERVRKRGASHKQQHLLAWLERHPLEEHDLLRKRVELGDLPAERLALAANLGYQPAMRALAQKLPRDVDWLTKREVSTWAESLKDAGPEVQARIGHALGRSVLHFWECEYPDDRYPHAAVIALENWVYAPDPVRRAYGPLVKDAGSFTVAWPWTTGTSSAAAHVTMRAVDHLEGSWPGESLLSYAVETWMNLSSLLEDHPRPGVPLSRKRALAQVRQTLREMVVPWVLQRCDPVRDALAPLALDLEAFPGEDQGTS